MDCKIPEKQSLNGSRSQKKRSIDIGGGQVLDPEESSPCAHRSPGILEKSGILPLQPWAVAVGRLFVDHDSDLVAESIEQALPVLCIFCSASASAFISDTHALQTKLSEPPLLGQDESHSWPGEQRGKSSQRLWGLNMYLFMWIISLEGQLLLSVHVSLVHQVNECWGKSWMETTPAFS